MRLCAVTFKKLILYSLAAHTVAFGSYILPLYEDATANEGERRNVSL